MAIADNREAFLSRPALGFTTDCKTYSAGRPFGGCAPPLLCYPFFAIFAPAVADLVIDLIAIVVVAVCIGLSMLLRDPKMMRRHKPMGVSTGGVREAA